MFHFKAILHILGTLLLLNGLFMASIALNTELVEKIKFDKISDEKTSILNEPNYTNIIKSAVSNSDAIVKGSKQIPEEIDEEITKNDIPALSFQEEDSFESYLNFYEELISEE